MKITIVAIGKKDDQALASSTEEYMKRLRHYAKIEWKLLEAKITASMSENQIRDVESSVLASSIQTDDMVVLLDERGTELSSPVFADKLQGYMNKGIKNLVIIIGGAYGVNEELTKRADFIWSLSQLVFPHKLVRLILAEQLYRAYSILAGEKYHHQ